MPEIEPHDAADPRSLIMSVLDNGPQGDAVMRALDKFGYAVVRVARPKIIDDDRNTISVSLDGKELQSWFYANDGDRREKMRHAHYFCDGFMCCQGARKITADEIAR